MLHFYEAFPWFSANPLRRRVESDQIGVLGFELLELTHQAIEVGVAELGIVQNVIAIFVMPDLFA